MKATMKRMMTAVAAIAVLTMVAASGTQAAAPKRHHAPLRHRTYQHRTYHHATHRQRTRRHSQYVLRRTPAMGTDIIDTSPVARPRKVPATPVPRTPGAIPATPPIAPGASGDTRTPMTPPGVGGTGVPGGPGTQP